MKNSFVMYTDYLEQFDMLTDEQAGKLIKAIFRYEVAGEIMEMDAVVKMAFMFIKSQLDRDADKYEEVCEKRKEAGRLGGLAKASNAKQGLANAKFATNDSSKSSKAKQSLANLADNDTDNDIDNDNGVEDVNDNEGDKNKKHKRFKPPTANEVKEYCVNGGFNIDPDAFVDFYEAKGWMVGKNKMKDWKAAVRNWARSNNKKPRQEKTADVFDEWRNA